MLLNLLVFIKEICNWFKVFGILMNKRTSVMVCCFYNLKFSWISTRTCLMYWWLSGWWGST